MNAPLLAALGLALVAAPFVAAHDPAGSPKNYCEPVSEWGLHDYGPPANGGVLAPMQDGNVLADCDPDTPLVGEYDGHSEYAMGGAWILACESGCGTGGLGASACYGEMAHHAEYATFSVVDLMLTNADFTVGADNDAPCGDFLIDDDEQNSGGSTISVGFGAGADGAYHVYVTGTQGHVLWPLG